jgi:hypothetical protein
MQQLKKVSDVREDGVMLDMGQCPDAHYNVDNPDYYVAGYNTNMGAFLYYVYLCDFILLMY